MEFYCKNTKTNSLKIKNSGSGNVYIIDSQFKKIEALSISSGNIISENSATDIAYLHSNHSGSIIGLKAEENAFFRV